MGYFSFLNSIILHITGPLCVTNYLYDPERHYNLYPTPTGRICSLSLYFRTETVSDHYNAKSGLEVIKMVSCSIQLSMKF